MADVLAVDPRHPDAALLNRAAECLRGGGLVAFPTESFYGLGASARSVEGINRLVAVKQADRPHPVLVLVGDRDQVSVMVESYPPLAEQLMHRFWPGPLTLVLPARASVPSGLTGGTGRIGVRWPALPLATALVLTTGLPVTATSANRSGGSPPVTAMEVEASLGGEIDLILDGGPTAGGPPSTVLDLCGERPMLIREGRVTVEELVELCGPIDRPSSPPADPARRP